MDNNSKYPGNSLDYQMIFEQLPGNFLVIAADAPRFTLLAASDSAIQGHKLNRQEVVGKALFDVFPANPDDPDFTAHRNTTASLMRVIQQKVADSMAVQRHDIPVEGGFEERYWSPINSPVLDSQGRVICIIHRVEDVTEFVKLRQMGQQQEAMAEVMRSRASQMEAEIIQRAREVQEANQQLRQVNQRLAELDKAKSIFLSNVSHELRTPLTLIMGPIQDELARDLPAESRQSLEIAQRNSLRLLRLVNTLLDFTRLEAGRMKPAFEPLDLGEFTRNLASNFSSACQNAGIRLQVDCPSLPQPVFVDREMWEKMVLNLMSNALKFTNQGSIRVSLHATTTHAVFQVQDSGVGIPQEELSLVFERFYQSPTSRGRSQEGTGIGLALVSELLNLLKGSIDVDSSPGKGSTFTIKIPLGMDHIPAELLHSPQTSTTPTAARAYVEEALQWLPVQPQGTEDQKLHPGQFQDMVSQRLPWSSEGGELPHILWADDNADMRSYVSGLLKNSYKLTEVADGHQALEKALLNPPDLVLADVMMPRMDGFQLLQALRNHPQTRSIPVVLLSARAGEEARIEGIRAGADFYLVKPFSARELLAVINGQISMARIHRETRNRISALSAALLLGEQKERKRFSKLLHENLQQKLAGSLLLTRQHQVDLQIGQADPQDIGEAVSVLEQAVNTARLLAIEMDPPILADEGLDAALRWLQAHMRRNYGLEVNLEMYGPLSKVRREKQFILAQAVRELLFNVKRHAGVEEAFVKARCKNDMVCVEVRDAGKGFETGRIFDQTESENHFGLQSIRGRFRLFGGGMHVESSPGIGTLVKLSFPLESV